MVKNFTDDNFEAEVLTASKNMPVLVDFFATWCEPCQAQSPIVDELAAELDGQVSFGKLNTEEAMLTAQKYGVMSIPTLLIFKNGEVVKKFVGLQTKETLKLALAS